MISLSAESYHAIAIVTFVVLLLLMNLPFRRRKKKNPPPLPLPIGSGETPFFSGGQLNIECVIVSVNYGDFLAHTLPFNKNQFNNMVVVTTPGDIQTKKVCDFYNVRCVQTDEFYADGAKFNKGRGINAGLQALSRSDWLVHMDADIVLPPAARRFFELKNLNKQFIYGIDRLMCESYEQWCEFVTEPKPQHELDVYVHPVPFDLGTRIAKQTEGGYIPIGFFQMWHASAGHNCYSIEHTDAARSDMLFALQWPPEHRQLIPEVFGYHLATEDYSSGTMGKNWGGRVTKRFGISGEKSQGGY